MEFDFLRLLDGFGTIAFALTGCVVAARKHTDLVGFWFLAIVTGIGGGTVRDCVLGLAPVFWVKDPTPLILCSIVALGSFWLLRGEDKTFRSLLIWADALGLAFFAVVGATITLDSGAPWFIALLLGTITAVGGGLIRDMLAGEPTLVLRREIYASACVIGILAYIALVEGWFGGPLHRDLAIWVGFGFIFVIRALAIFSRYELPGYGESATLKRRKVDQ